MDKRIQTKLGQWASAITAIGIAGCLIQKQQAPQQAILVERTKQEDPYPFYRESHKESVVSEELAKSPVEEILFARRGERIPLSSLSEEEFLSLMKDIRSSRTDPVFFSTSKSASVPVEPFGVHLTCAP